MAKKKNNLFSKLSLLGFFILLAALAITVFYSQIQQVINSRASEKEVVQPFLDDARRGLSWAGIRSGKGDSLCGKLYEAVDKAGQVAGCTHGPDPAPEGINAAQSVEPLALGEDGGLVTANALSCDGDGTSGYRVQAIYVHASDKADRYSTFAGSFAQYASVVDTIFNESAAQTGGVRHVRFVTDSACNLAVSREVVSTTGDDSVGNLAVELRDKGYNRTDRKYLVWVDATTACGVALLANNDSASQTNPNNIGPSYTYVGSGCWGGGTEAHELMHTLGGVQLSAPHSTSGYHCTDDYDRMCYKDSTAATMTYPCASTEENHFDCNKDDYFSTNPPANSYLATHWNTANNRFLIGAIAVAPSTTPTPTLQPTINDTLAPTISVSNPTNGAIIGNRVTISASATDNVGVVNMQIYIDGSLRISSTTGSISTSWNARKASIGTHSITVKANDAKGNTSSSTITVYK